MKIALGTIPIMIAKVVGRNHEGTLYLMAQKVLTASLHCFFWQKQKKTLAGWALSEPSCHQANPKTQARLSLWFASDLPWRHNSLRVFHPTRVKNNKNLARKTFFNRMELWFLKDFVFHVFYFASNLADRLLGRWRTGRQACLNGMGFAYTAYSPSEWIDGKVFLLFLFVPTGK